MASIGDTTATSSNRHTPRPPFLPMSREEMALHGWDELDVLLVSGDAYVDHPAFGAAIVARCLEAAGFRVGIVAQPRWNHIEDLLVMGRPRLFVGVTAGNLDSMLNKLTAQKKTRSLDAYSPDGTPGQRPNRASIVYAQLCRQAFPQLPVVLGGIEASLRRIAHYDYWSDAVRRSILLDAKADLLVFGMAESTIVAVARGLEAENVPSCLKSIRGTAFALTRREVWEPLLAKRRSERIGDGGIVELPSLEAATADPKVFARMTRLFELESNPHHARPLVQPHGNEAVYLNPPALPLSTEELDALYALPFQRRPHPRYDGHRIPAFDTIKDSVVALRGCYGGCSFCSISAHEGRIVQSRSQESIVSEVTRLAARREFNGTISDIGGPTANMYQTGCSDPEVQRVCRRPSCLHPRRCSRLNVSQRAYVALLRATGRVRGVRHSFIASGIRLDLANADPAFIEELAAHHVGGQLSVAPEHVSVPVLAAMRKPPVETYERFVDRFGASSLGAGKQQYVVPYFVVGHPGTRLSEAIELALYLKRHGLRPRQVQEFIPTPMTVATSMYHTGLDPMTEEPVAVVRDPRELRLQKALALYYDPNEAAHVREALRKAGRYDLIGTRPTCLIGPATPRDGHRAGVRNRPHRKANLGPPASKHRAK